MPPAALGLVLAAAVLHALWNIAAKRVTGDGVVFVWWYNLCSTVLWLPLGIILWARAGWPLSWPLLVAPLVSSVVHIGYELTLQTGCQRADLSVVYPTARGTGPLLTMVVAVALLGERPGVPGLIGGLVIVAGIVVVAAAPSGRGDRNPLSGVAWGAATGTAIAAYTLWDDHAMAHWGLIPVTYFALSCTWQTALMTPAVRRRSGTRPLVPVLCRYWREVVIVAVASPLAYILVLQVMRTVPVSLVAPARESSIVVGALLGWLLFKEPHPARRLVGAAVVLGGIALIVV